MPAKTGRQYFEGLKAQPREIWLRGERIDDVTTHPALCRGAETMAAIYDMQHDAALRDAMTFESPSTGERVGLSFIIPKTQDELVRRGQMSLHWARRTCGMMGRLPDFLNVTFAAWAGAADFFARSRPEFGANIRRYHEYIRENDITLTHALINLQPSRNPTGVPNLTEGDALHIVKETDAGIVVRGARVLATLGPLSDEIAVYSPRLSQFAETHSPYAMNFALPCGTPGLRFLCRESLDAGRSHFDHPLGSRFEEMDCVVFFDDVLVPWERVFALNDVEHLNATPWVTHSSNHTAHQGAIKNIAKCEFVLGVALLVAETLGNRELPHVQDRLGELVMYTELMRACVRAGEADAFVNEFGVMTPATLPIETTRNLFMTAYPRMVEILQLLGSSSFMITPAEADFDTPLAADIERHLATASTPARERVGLFHLAWDIALSSFGSRQVLYERFFASDPLSRARSLLRLYPKDEAMSRVRDFLNEADNS